MIMLHICALITIDCSLTIKDEVFRKIIYIYVQDVS